MPKDRDQLTPDEPEDAQHLATHRGQGTAGTGRDLLSGPTGSGGTAQEAAPEEETGAGEGEPGG